MEQTPEQILRSARTILLVDWSDQRVPRALVNAGFSVFGYSPDGYSVASIADEKPRKADGCAVFQPGKGGEKGFLVFENTAERPRSVDIVNVYRPEAEHALILEKQVLTTGARVMWLHPPATSATVKNIAAANHIILIEGVDIADIAAKI